METETWEPCSQGQKGRLAARALGHRRHRGWEIWEGRATPALEVSKARPGGALGTKCRKAPARAAGNGLDLRGLSLPADWDWFLEPAASWERPGLPPSTPSWTLSEECGLPTLPFKVSCPRSLFSPLLPLSLLFEQRLPGRRVSAPWGWSRLPPRPVSSARFRLLLPRAPRLTPALSASQGSLRPRRAGLPTRHSALQ